jgi:hypothetical protein
MPQKILIFYTSPQQQWLMGLLEKGVLMVLCNWLRLLRLTFRNI